MTNEETAKHIFARNPKVKDVHFTSDGTPFYEKHHAEAHSQRLKDKDIATISKGAKKEADKVTPPASEFPEGMEFLGGNVTQVSEEIKKVATVEELGAILNVEVAVGNRKGVKNAIAERKAELESNQNPE